SNGMKAIAQFLVAKSGYCIHFASAMAVLARPLGIPSRVAVGLLPGEKQDQTVEGRTSYRVTTQDVHAWAELYFDGIGWTRFEPTPGRGFVPTYADKATPGVPIPPTTTTPSATPTPTPTTAPTNSAKPINPNDPTASSGNGAMPIAWLWSVLILLGAMLLLLVPAIVRIVQRRVRLRRLGKGYPLAQTGWKELLQSVNDLGVDVSSTATPREAAGVIARAARLSGSGQAILDSVLGLVERQSFAGESSRSATSSSGTPAHGSAWEDRIRSVLDLVRSASGWRTRLVAALAPRSIWSRLVFSRAD
ncbi:MAG: transglutaminase-like domain-containing protein, partial [Terrimesophilobacter sp.]